MKPQTIARDGRIFGFGANADESDAMIDGILTRASTDRGFVWLSGCERCAVVCVSDFALCACCLAYRTVYYPDDGKHHTHLTLVADFVAKVNARAARGAVA